MYAEKGDLLQFILTKNVAKSETKYLFVLAQKDIDYYDNTVEYYGNNFRIERDFHRFNVIKTSLEEPTTVHLSNPVYIDRIKSSLFVFETEEPEEETEEEVYEEPEEET